MPSLDDYAVGGDAEGVHRCDVIVPEMGVGDKTIDVLWTPAASF